MAGKATPVVFVTANVGSIFEEPLVMLKIWTEEFLSTISRLDPKFIALHCQEVGGKNYEKSMEHVKDFVELLVGSYELRLFDKVRIYLDEDYSSAENFTALGNFYFIHESITDVLTYDFESRKYVEVSGREIHSQNIEHVTTKEKSKFPLAYFPECKWSRKGFMRTRWNLNGAIFDLVNIHLFHDASNFVAIEACPSVYSDTRRHALTYTLDRFQNDENGSVPFFLFGDFNFRTDTKGVVKHLSEGLDSSTSEGEVSIIQFKREDKVILSLGKKEFSHSDHQTIFTAKDGDWLKEFDRELDAFSDQLFEFTINFPPSYPFEENSSGDRCYMKTRCPAWCDRVVLSRSAVPLVKEGNSSGNVTYSLMGRNTCMGDHKPVYLRADLSGDTAKENYPGESPRRLVPKCIPDENPSVTVSEDSNPVNSDGKTQSDKCSKEQIVKYREKEVEKLACSLEAIMAQNSSNFMDDCDEANYEPDLSRCSSCKTHRHTDVVVNNPGGEEGLSNENLVVEDQKIIGLLASEIRVPDSVLHKTEISDTGQKTEKETGNWTLENKVSEASSEPSAENNDSKSGLVKRVNSASMVESKPRKEDWKNARCNSDVAWPPATLNQVQDAAMRGWKMNRPFYRGNSRIRLISSSNSLKGSIPRLTSHHSSSDEEWFEEVTEGDDDVLKMKCDGQNDDNTFEEVSPSPAPNSEDKPATVQNLSDSYESSSRIEGAIEERISLKSEVSMEEFIKDHNDFTKPVVVDLVVANNEPLPVTESAPDNDTDLKPDNDTVPATADEASPESQAPNSESNERPEPGETESAFPASKMKSKSSKLRTLSILKRLTEGRKESQLAIPTIKKEDNENKESFENLIVDPNVENTPGETDSKGDVAKSVEENKVKPGCGISQKLFLFRTQNLLGDVKRKNSNTQKSDVAGKDPSESWETIELGDSKPKENEIKKDKNAKEKFSKGDTQRNDSLRNTDVENGSNECCCVVQ